MRPCTPLVGVDDDLGEWIAKQIPYGEPWCRGAGYCIGFVRGSQLEAAAAFFRYNKASIEVALASNGPRWLNRVNLGQLFGYPFEQLKVQRVTAIANASNMASRRLIEYIGFTLETTLVRAAPDGDQVVYRMFREDCRYV
jgi:hypothetical protein